MPIFALAKAFSSISVANIFTSESGMNFDKIIANVYGSSPVEQAALQIFGLYVVLEFWEEFFFQIPPIVSHCGKIQTHLSSFDPKIHSKFLF